MKACIRYENGNLDINDISINQKVREYYQKVKEIAGNMYTKVVREAGKVKGIKIEGDLEFKVSKKE